MTAEGNLSMAEAAAKLPDGPVVHTIALVDGDHLGQDQPRDQVLSLLRDAEAICPAPDHIRATGHGLAVHGGHGEVTFIETGARRDQLHLAVGTFAAYLVGQAGEDEVQAAVAAVPADQLAEYTEITEALGRNHRPTS